MAQYTNEELHTTMRRASRFMFNRGRAKGLGHKTGRRHAPSQERALSVLKENGTTRQQDMLELLNIRPSSLSELLGKLETKGYIKREGDPNDRRNSIISITPDGEELLAEVQNVHARRDEELFGILTDEERDQFGAILTKLQQYWAEKSEERGRRFRERGPHPDRPARSADGHRY